MPTRYVRDAAGRAAEALLLPRRRARQSARSTQRLIRGRSFSRTRSVGLRSSLSPSSYRTSTVPSWWTRTIVPGHQYSSATHTTHTHTHTLAQVIGCCRRWRDDGGSR